MSILIQKENYDNQSFMHLEADGVSQVMKMRVPSPMLSYFFCAQASKDMPIVVVK